jgi:hypothetical protein
MEITTKSLKIEFQDEMRRVPLIDKNFVSLEKQLMELYQLEKGTFIIKYKDEEGDLVTISSQIELDEAINCIGEQNPIKLKIIQAKETSKHPEGNHNHNHNHFHPRRVFNCRKWKNKANQKIDENGEQHPSFHLPPFSDKFHQTNQGDQRDGCPFSKNNSHAHPHFLSNHPGHGHPHSFAPPFFQRRFFGHKNHNQSPPSFGNQNVFEPRMKNIQVDFKKYMNKSKDHSQFQQKIEELNSMGFNDPQKNLKALFHSKGNLELAIQRLIE